MGQPRLFLVLTLLFLTHCATPGRAVQFTVTSGSDEGMRSYLQDEAGIFDPDLSTLVRSRIHELQEKTGCEIFLVTRLLADLDEIESEGNALFQELIRELEHYRAILIVLAYQESSRGVAQGKIYTALGRGLYHILTRADLQKHLGNAEERLTAPAVVEGIDGLADQLEQYYAENPGSAHEDRSGAGLDVLPGGSRTLAGLALVLASLLYLTRRLNRCPRCGARLQRRVDVLVRTKRQLSGQLRRTIKCLQCGYIRRRRMGRKVLGSDNLY